MWTRSLAEGPTALRPQEAALPLNTEIVRRDRQLMCQAPGASMSVTLGLESAGGLFCELNGVGEKSIRTAHTAPRPLTQTPGHLHIVPSSHSLPRPPLNSSAQPQSTPSPSSLKLPPIETPDHVPSPGTPSAGSLRTC